MSTRYDLLTFQDAVEHLIDVFDLEGATREERTARRAILAAYSDLSGSRNWARYQRLLRITVDAQQDDGTVTYVAATRQLTLTGATWPTNVIYGEVVIDNAIYEVDTYVSSTVITLQEGFCPTADIASATDYMWQRDRYPLPDDFQSMARLIDITSKRELSPTIIDDVITYKLQTANHGEPIAFCVTAFTEFSGGLGIQFCPVPTTAKTFEGAYLASPRSLRTKVYATGSVACTAGSTTITGVGTAFLDVHVGSVIRISVDDTTQPTGMAGYSNGDQNPWREQLVIRSVESTTSLTTEQPAIHTLAAGKLFTISDPIDMDVGAMQEYFLRLAEAKFARMEGREDANKREGIANIALGEACAADRRNWNGIDPPQFRGPVRLADIAQR
jgi:hypothetical protein